MSTATESRKPPSSRRTWRVRGVPFEVDKIKLATSLRCHPDLRPHNEYTAVGGDGDSISNGVSVQTLAPDLRLPWQVATVRFHNLPSQLDTLEGKGQLAIEMSIPTGVERQQELTRNRLTIDEHFDGITTLFSPPSDEKHQVDVLVISGLGSHPFGSFVHKGDGNMWLADSLPRDISAARVMIYGYSSGLQHSTSFAQLDDLAVSLQIAINQLLQTEKRKHLILIGHSLGGLLIKQALVQIADSDIQVLNMILGVLFFGTPNNGMDIESFIPMVNDQPNRLLLESLSSINSQILRLHKRDFSRLLGRTEFEIFCFYETDLSPTAAKDPITGHYKMNGPKKRLVDVDSATSCLPTWVSSDHSIPIPRPHSELVKFACHDSEYNIVVKVLENIMLSMDHSTETAAVNVLSPHPVTGNYRRVIVTLLYWEIDKVENLVKSLSDVFTRLYHYEVESICLVPDYQPVDHDFPWHDSHKIRDSDLQILYYIGATRPWPAASSGFIDKEAVSHSTPHHSLDRQGWLSSALGIPNVISDVLVILDSYWTDLSKERYQTIKHLSENDWARYGVIFAGYKDELSPPGRFSKHLVDVLQQVTKSNTLVNCRRIVADVSLAMILSDDNASPERRGDIGSFVLAPIFAMT